MAFFIYFIIGLLLSLGLQRWFRRAVISLIVPSIGFVAYALFCEFVLPSSEGGASIWWTLALLFGIPVIFIGSIAGFLLCRFKICFTLTP